MRILSSFRVFAISVKAFSFASCSRISWSWKSRLDVLSHGPAGDQLGSCLVDEQDGVAHFGEGVLDPAHRGGFARAGAARDHDLRDLLFAGACTEQVVHRNAEHVREPVDQVYAGLCPAAFPFGYGLVGHAELFTEPGLGKACLFPQLIQMVTECEIRHVFHLRLQCKQMQAVIQGFPVYRR